MKAQIITQELLFTLSFIDLAIPQVLTEHNCFPGIVAGTSNRAASKADQLPAFKKFIFNGSPSSLFRPGFASPPSRGGSQMVNSVPDTV